MSFFADIFRAELRSDGLIALSIRANQNRVDEFVLLKGDVTPALNDDPGTEWAGSARFALKRSHSSGQLRVSGIHGSSVYRFSRHALDKLHASLVQVCRVAPDLGQAPKVVPQEIVSEPRIPDVETPLDFAPLVGQLAIIIQQEMDRLRDELGALKAVETVRIIEKAVPVEIEVPVEVPVEVLVEADAPFTPGIFIPGRIGQDLKGSIAKKQQTTSSALSAAKKLKKLKEQ